MSWSFIELNNKDHLGAIASGVISYKGDRSLLKKASLSTHKIFKSKTLSWSEDLGRMLADTFYNVRPPLRNIEIPSNFDEDLQYHLRRFFISLDAYIESPNPVIHYSEIIRGCFTKGPEYASFLKKLRSKAFITSVRLEFIETPEWFHDMPEYRINDIGDIFNYSYLIHWKESSEDYKYGDLEIENLSGIPAFKEILWNLLPDSIEFPIIEPEEILLDLKSSNVFETLKKNPQHFELKSRFLEFNKIRETCKRTVIQVAPDGARDTVMNPIKDINTISLIEQQTQQLLQTCFKKNVVNRNQYVFDRRYNKFQKTFKHFLCRDFTKEGITKPRALLVAMLEVLHKKYPTVPGWDFVDFYKNFEVYDPEIGFFTPKRGHGLGMANALTTLMQIIVVNMTYSNMQDEFISETDFLTENDDIIFGFNRKTEMWSYWNEEEEILLSLGLIRNPKKSFLGRGGVFLERYFTKTVPTKIGEKESYQRREILLALAAHNITQAKAQIASLTYLSHDLLDIYKDEIITFWGYEFFPDEIDYPTSLGGWYNRSIFGIRMDLDQIDSLPYDNHVYKAFNACKHHIIFPWTETNIWYQSVALKLYPELETTNKDIIDYLDISDPSPRYQRLKFNPERNSSLWDKLMKRRQSCYKQNWDQQYDLFIKEFLEFYDEEEFYPNREMIQSYAPSEEYIGNLQDPWTFGNPKLNLIKYLLKIDNWTSLPNDWNWRNFSWKEFNFKKTSEQRKRLRRMLLNSSIIGEMSSNSIILPTEEFWEEFQSCYTNPIGVAKVSQLMELSYRVPILKEIYRKSIIKSRETVYKKVLSRPEFCLLAQMGESARLKFAKLIREDPNILYKLRDLSSESESTVSEPSSSEDDDYYQKLKEAEIIKTKTLTDEEFMSLFWKKEAHQPVSWRHDYERLYDEVQMWQMRFFCEPGYTYQVLSTGYVGKHKPKEVFISEGLEISNLSLRSYDLWQKLYKRTFPGEYIPLSQQENPDDEMGFNLEDLDF